MINVAIVPGNGGGRQIDVAECNWYGFAKRAFDKPEKGVVSYLRNMPDPVLARESIWLPFMVSDLGCGPNSIIIGHSSGAVAAMRFAEKSKVKGIVLVGAYTSDQGDETEAASGYFSRPWDWEAIKSNCGFMIQFASRDDPFLPWSEQETVATMLGAELFAYSDRGHFLSSTIPELPDAVWAKINSLQAQESTLNETSN
jgi:predicted alpha/beta hydrolase family esterase